MAPIAPSTASSSRRALALCWPFLAIMGTIQPDKLSCFNAGLRFGQVNDGSLDRFLFSYQAERPAAGYRLKSELSTKAKDGWHRVIASLMALRMAGKKHQPCPQFAQFTSDAGDHFERVTDTYAAEDAGLPAPFERGLVEVFPRGHLARLAVPIVQLLLGPVAKLAASDVEACSVQSADALVRYFKSHTRKCYQVMAADPPVAAR